MYSTAYNLWTLHDLYTLNSLSGWKGRKKFIPTDSLNSPLIYILFYLVMIKNISDFNLFLLYVSLVICYFLTYFDFSAKRLTCIVTKKTEVETIFVWTTNFFTYARTLFFTVTNTFLELLIIFFGFTNN